MEEKPEAAGEVVKWSAPGERGSGVVVAAAMVLAADAGGGAVSWGAAKSPNGFVAPGVPKLSGI